MNRSRRIAVLVPLTALCAAWSVAVATSGTAPVEIAQSQPSATATARPEVDPSPPGVTQAQGRGVVQARTQETLASLRLSATSGELPAAARTAYARAELVMTDADPDCGLEWTLLAAVGRVLTNHGQIEGSKVGANGVVTPALVGPALDGRAGRDEVRDSDDGLVDGDRRWDRAVGPLQLLPSMWAMSAVDADRDGRRDPNDLNDAALGLAVQLCATGSDLATRAGQRTALAAISDDEALIDSVLSVAVAYQAASDPNREIRAVSVEYPASSTVIEPRQSQTADGHAVVTTVTKPLRPGPGKVLSTPVTTPTQAPQQRPQRPTASPRPVAVPEPPLAEPTPSLAPVADQGPVSELLTKTEATTLCLAEFGYSTVTQLVTALANPLNLGKGLATLGDLNKCVDALLR